MEHDKYYNSLIQVLRLVASPYDSQITFFPNFVNIPEEIALLYHDSYLTTSRLHDEKKITLRALNMLYELNALFNTMSNNSYLWTQEKLKNNEMWSIARESAIKILNELNEKYDSPNLGFVTWLT